MKLEESQTNSSDLKRCSTCLFHLRGSLETIITVTVEVRSNKFHTRGRLTIEKDVLLFVVRSSNTFTECHRVRSRAWHVIQCLIKNEWSFLRRIGDFLYHDQIEVIENLGDYIVDGSVRWFRSSVLLYVERRDSNRRNTRIEGEENADDGYWEPWNRIGDQHPYTTLLPSIWMFLIYTIVGLRWY